MEAAANRRHLVSLDPLAGLIALRTSVLRSPGEPGGWCTSGGSHPLQESPDVSGLSDVLQTVADNADQADSQGDGRVPGLVDDSPKVGLLEAPGVPHGPLEDRFVIVTQQIYRLDPYRRYVARPVPIPDRMGRKR
jgi:hypothetical protein